MPEEIDNDAPSLESFNEPATKSVDATPTDDSKKAAQDPAPEDAANKKAAEADADKAKQTNTEPTNTAEDDKNKDKTQPTDDKTKTDDDIYAFIDSMTAENVKQDPEAVKKFKEIAKANNLTPEAAKAIAQFQLDMAKKQNETFLNLQKSWVEEAQNTYGENLKNVETNCSRVLAELDKEGKFKELLALVGAEKHPATLGFLKAVGDKMLEKPAVNPNATVSGDEHEPELEDFN